MHPVRAARVAILHTWTEHADRRLVAPGVRLATQIPYTTSARRTSRRTPNLNAKYDVIVFGPAAAAARAIIDGMPMWRNPMPWKNSPETPNIGTWAQTDDMRPGLGYEGLQNLQKFVKNGGVYIGSVASAQFAIDNGLTNGVGMNTAARGTVTGSFLKTHLVDDRERSLGQLVPQRANAVTI